jgi:hypothetical protein
MSSGTLQMFSDESAHYSLKVRGWRWLLVAANHRFIRHTHALPSYTLSLVESRAFKLYNIHIIHIYIYIYIYLYRILYTPMITDMGTNEFTSNENEALDLKAVARLLWRVSALIFTTLPVCLRHWNSLKANLIEINAKTNKSSLLWLCLS